MPEQSNGLNWKFSEGNLTEVQILLLPPNKRNNSKNFKILNMKKCSICGREIKSSGEKTVKIIINDKKRIYCSECQQKSEVQAEIKAVKSKIYGILIPAIIGIVIVLALIIGGVI
jgi:hypothetical protein